MWSNSIKVPWECCHYKILQSYVDHFVKFLPFVNCLAEIELYRIFRLFLFNTIEKSPTQWQKPILSHRRSQAPVKNISDRRNIRHLPQALLLLIRTGNAELNGAVDRFSTRQYSKIIILQVHLSAPSNIFYFVNKCLILLI